MSDIKPTVVKAWPIESSSTPGLEYAVIEWSNGRMTCECPAFIRGKQQRGLGMFERSCKHTVAAEQQRGDLTRGLVGSNPTPTRPKVVSGDPFALMDEAEKEKLR